jgi:hypothetical protein
MVEMLSVKPMNLHVVAPSGISLGTYVPVSYIV